MIGESLQKSYPFQIVEEIQMDIGEPSKPHQLPFLVGGLTQETFLQIMVPGFARLEFCAEMPVLLRVKR